MSLDRASIGSMGNGSTVKCHHNVVQSITILLMVLWWQEQNSNQTSNPQQTSHTSPLRASYGMSIVMILEKIDCIITEPHCAKELYLPFLAQCGNVHLLTWEHVIKRSDYLIGYISWKLTEMLVIILLYCWTVVVPCPNCGDILEPESMTTCLIGEQ